MSAHGIAFLEADLRNYLQHKTSLFCPQFDEVVVEVITFTSACFRDGFRKTLAGVVTTAKTKCSFLEICEAVVECQVRIVQPAERELIGKSLSEAYILFAGPQCVFEPASNTQFMRRLRDQKSKGFVGVFLSLHLFNVICMEISDRVAASMPDRESYEMYMFGMEGICRNVVARAMKMPDGQLDQRWASAIISSIEAQLLW